MQVKVMQLKLTFIRWFEESLECCWGSLQGMWLALGWVLPSSTDKQVSYRWEGGPVLLQGVLGVKNLLELEKPYGLKSCAANTGG